MILLLCAFAGARGQVRESADLPHEMGLPSVPGSGTEIRVWIESIARVNTLYRITKVGERVSVERIAFSAISSVDPAKSNDRRLSEMAARDTSESREFMAKRNCSGKIVETPNYLWCRTRLQNTGPWDDLFVTLFPEQLWNLAPRGPQACSEGVLDGETVTIEILAPGRRHSVSYHNPTAACCTTLDCTFVLNVRSIVESLIR